MAVYPNPAVDDEEDQPVVAPAVRKPRIGTTGGEIPEQQSEIDARQPTQWAADPAERRQQVQGEIAKQRTQAFQAEHPFTPGSWQPKINTPETRYQDRQVAAGAEEQFNYQQQQARAAVTERKAAALEQQKASNDVAEAKYRGSGQQFYTDAHGRIVPVLEAGTNRPLFNQSKWEVTKHPKTGKTVMSMTDKYGQRQFREPQVVPSLDPTDDNMYHRLPDGTLSEEPAGTIDELAASPDYRVAKTALAAKKAHTHAVYEAALARPKEMADEANSLLQDAKAQRDDLNAQIEESTKLLETIDDPVKREGMMSTITQQTAARDQVNARVTGRGDLANMAARHRAAYVGAKARQAVDTYRAQEAEITARVRASGGKLEDDPAYQDNLRNLQLNEQAAQAAEMQFQRASGGTPVQQATQQLAQPTPTSGAGRQAATDTSLQYAEPIQAMQRGETHIGSVPIREFARRYGDGRGPVQPASLVKLYQRSKEIEQTLANPDTSVSQVLRDQMQKEKDYVDQLATQRLARLPEDMQKRVTESTRDPTWWDTIKGAAKSLAEEAAVGGGAVMKGAAQISENIGPIGNLQTGQIDPQVARQFYEARAGETPQQKMDRIKGSPAYELGSFIQDAAKESYSKNPHEDEGAVSKALNAAAGAAGGFAPLIASGPVAPITMGLQTAGDDMQRIYDEQIKKGVDPQRAADFAQKRALASGAIQTALFEILPKPLQKLGNKIIVDKIAGGALKKFLANRLAQGAEGAVLGGATTAAGNVTAGRDIGEGVSEGAAGLGLMQAVMPRAGRPGEAQGGKPAPKKPTKPTLTPEQQTAEAEFQKRLTDEPAPPFEPKGKPSTAADAARTLEPALAEKANVPPPAKPAAESAKAIVEAQDTAEVANKVSAQQESKAQKLVDQIQEASGKPREEILATRKGREAGEWAKELESEAKYQKSPLTVDPERRVTELKADLKKLDEQWDKHLEKTAAEAETHATIQNDKDKAGAQFQITKARHDALMERRGAIEQQLVEAERIRQSNKGGADLAKDLGAKEGREPPPEEPGSAPAKPTEPKTPAGGSAKDDLKVATETNEQINRRHPKPGAGRDAAMAERTAASKRIAKTLKPGDKVGDFTIYSVNKDGTINTKTGAGIDIASEIQAREPITRGDIIDRVSEMSPREVRDWAHNEAEGGPTGESDKLGIASIGKPDRIAKLKSAHEKAKAEFKRAQERARSATGDAADKAENDANALSAKVQFFSEAIAAAENTGSAVHSPEVAKAHAEAADLTKGDNFDKAWEAGGKQAGSENQIVIKDGRVYKRNYNAGLEKAYPNHETKAAFDEHLALHNKIFPETALKFEGMSETKDGPAPVVSQAEVKGTEATKPEIDAFMAAKGFEPYSGSAYVNKKEGLRVGDLKGDNVLKDEKGVLHVIDPVIKRIAKSEEKPNATKTGSPERELQHPRASQGPAVSENVGEPREVRGEQASGGDRAIGGEKAEGAGAVPEKVAAKAPTILEQRKAEIERRRAALTDERGNTPPSQMKPAERIAELTSNGVKEINGKPLADANAAEIINALGKLRRGQLEEPATAAKAATKEPSVSAKPDLIARLEAKKKKITREELLKPTALVDPIVAYKTAHNVALDLAIAGIRAGRAINDVIQLAIKRFKAKFPDHTDDHVAQLEADIRSAIADRPPEPAPGTAKSKVPESLREVGTPSEDITYDVRAQNATMAEARAAISKDPANAEAMISDRKLPADTRVAIGGVLLEKKMTEMANAKPEDLPALTRDIQRITAATRSGVSTESGQGVAMHSKIYENLGVGSAMEYTKAVDKKRQEIMGGDDAQKAAKEAADIFNKTTTQTERDAAIEKLKDKYSTKPVRRMLDQLKRIEVAKELNKLGVLTRDDMIDVAGNAMGIPGIKASKLKHIAELADRITKAANHAERSRAELELADTLNIYKGVNPLDLEASVLTLNILSGPTTQAANLQGNALNLISQLGTTAAVNPGKIGPLMKGLMEGIPLGWDQAKSIMATGRGTRDFQDRTMGSSGSALSTIDYARDFPKLNKTAGDALTLRARAVDKISRFMKAADAVFYYPAREAYARLVTTKLLEGDFKGAELAKKVSETLHTTPEAFEAARRQAEAEGYNGIDRARRVSDIIEEKRLTTTAGTEAVKQSERFAAESTYNNEPVGLAGVIYRNLARTVKDADVAGVPVLKPWAMFLRVPANVFNTTTNYTPMGASRAFFGTKGEKYRKGGSGEGQWRNFTKDERNRLYLQSVVGTTLMAGLTARILSNDDVNISAAGPNDINKRNQLKAAGWNPYSIKIGKKWVSYRDSPLLVPLAIVGHVADAVRYQKSKSDLVLGSKVADAVSHAPQIIFQTSMLSGLSDLMASMGGQGDVMKNLERTLGSIPANLLIPYNRLLQQVDQTFDTKVYQGNPVKDAVPFLRRTGTPQTDVQSRPKIYDPSTRFVSTEKNDPVDNMLRSKNVFIPEATKDTKIGNRVMTPEEYDAFRNFTGKRIRIRLQTIAPQFRGLSQEQAQKRVEQISREERERAKPLIGSGFRR